MTYSISTTMTAMMPEINDTILNNSTGMFNINHSSTAIFNTNDDSMALFNTTNDSLAMLNLTNSAIDQHITNKETLALTRLIVQRILVPLITTIGVFGNIVSICVLTRKCMRSSTNTYLTTLAIFDLMYLLFSFTLSLKHYKTIKSQDIYTYMFPYMRGLADISSNVSVYLTVTFSLERLVAVCYPMKGRTICTPERARIITIVIAVFGLVCTAPEFFEWKVVKRVIGNTTKVHITNTDMAEDVSYQVGYTYFIICTFTILPLILLSTFNGILIKSVLAATRIRRELTYNSIQKDAGRRHNEQNRITVMLIGVVLVFLVCQFPNAAVLLYSCYIELSGLDLSAEGIINIKIAGNIVNLMVLINASINFLLYSVMSTKFRRVFFQLFCRLIRGEHDLYSRTEMTYYNSAVGKSQTSPLRYRSKRLNSTSVTGATKNESIKYSYMTCKSNRYTNGLNTYKKNGPSISSNTSSNSDIKNTRTTLKNTPSKQTKDTFNTYNDDLYKVYGVESEVVVWENVTPLEDVSTECAKEITCVRNNNLRTLGRAGYVQNGMSKYAYRCQAIETSTL